MATLAKFLAVFIIVAIILAILLFLFMPRFFYNLNVKDGWKSWTDKRYQLFVFVHKRFRKAMTCGQIYERFVDETLRIYNKDNFQKEKSEFDNNKMMNDLVILSEILDDEGFVRKHFCEDSFTYSSYLKMMNDTSCTLKSIYYARCIVVKKLPELRFWRTSYFRCFSTSHLPDFDGPIHSMSKLFRRALMSRLIGTRLQITIMSVSSFFDTNCCFRQRLVRGDIRVDIRGDKMYSISNLNGQTFIETGGFGAVKNISELV